ncbi:MAG: helix-turn-helix domain-containing protein [Marmoricola sp.]
MPERRVARAYPRAAEAFGRKVAAVRVMRQLTQEELADRTGISRNQIQNIERNRSNRIDPATGRPGNGNARLDTVFLLAEQLRVDVTYLIDPDVPVTPVPSQ